MAADLAGNLSNFLANAMSRPMDQNRARSRSRSPKYTSPSRSPREWKRPERRMFGGDRSDGRGGNRDRRSGGGGGGGDDHGNRFRLHISNIPYDVRWQDLKDTIRDKIEAEVSYVELYMNDDGKPSGSGVIEVKSQEVMDKAIRILHRMDVKGREMIVREERKTDRMKFGGGGGGGGGMSDRGHGNSRFDRRDSMDMGGHGSGVASLMSAGIGGMGGGGNMMGDGGMGLLGAGGPMGGGGMGLGAGLDMMGGAGFNLQFLSQLGIDIANITNQVFVANLDYKVTVSKVEEIFKIAGNVIEVDLKLDKDTQKSRGICTVRFEHPMEAVQAICLFNGQFLYDRQMGVRMDRWVDPILQDIPRRLPAGLKGMGIGMGSGGQPVLNIGQISNTLTLSMLTGQLNASNIGGASNNLAAALGGTAMGGLQSNMMAMNAGGLGGLGSVNSSVANLLGGLATSQNLSNLQSLQGLGMNLNAGNLAGLGTNILGSSSMANAGNTLGLMGGASLGGLSTANLSGLGGLGGLGQNLMSDLGGNRLGGGGMMGGSLGDVRGSGMMGGDSFSGGGGLMGLLDRGNMGGGGGGGGNVGMGFDRNDSFGSNRGENTSVFVRNLPFSYTWQNLVEKFRDCGEVKFAEIKQENGRSKGCGVVQFHSSDAARRAISMMNGVRVEGRHIEVQFDRLA